MAFSILLYGGDFVWGKNEMKYNLACETKKKIEDMGIEVMFFRGNHDNSLAKYGFVFSKSFTYKAT
ncbi:MAG: metallophosphoesterase [Fibromonadales bacterium]|nr:metallophosphoesterase [Fibromonadales bacterium]